MTKQTLLIC